VDLGDEDMLDEIDESLVDSFSSTSFADHQVQSSATSAAAQEGKDVERLVDLGMSDIHSQSTDLSPNSRPDPYKHDRMNASPKPHSPYELYSALPSPRLSIPPHLLNPEKPDALQSSIMESWASTEPTQESKDYLAAFLERLSVVINLSLGDPRSGTKKGLRRFEVDLFGSMSWGGTTGAGGDIDMILLVIAFLTIDFGADHEQDKVLPHGCACIEHPVYFS